MTVWGVEPEILGEYDLKPSEFQYYVYLPVKMAGRGCFLLPPNLDWMADLLHNVKTDTDDYVYVTVKHMIHQAGCPVNRPGWHSDGFGTDDENYIWYDSQPTEFAIGDFETYECVPEDDKLSLDHFERWALFLKLEGKMEFTTYPCKTLIKMDQHVIHQVSEKPFTGTRCFVKISVSKNKYDLQGNSHNYLFDYDWEMKPREVTRNQPSTEEIIK